MILYDVIFLLLIMIYFGMVRKRRRGYGGDADRTKVKEAGSGLKAAILNCRQIKEQLTSFE